MNEPTTVQYEGDRLDARLQVQPELTDQAVAHLRDTLAWLTEHPERHDQEVWIELPTEMTASIPDGLTRWNVAPFERPAALGSTGNCGATGCLAGWLVLRDPSIPLVQTWGGDVYPANRRADGAWAMSQTGDTGFTARDVLGLSPTNASALFADGNTLGDLWRMCSIITGGRIDVPEEFAS